MAVGDKKPVVMEEDMAVPGGIATLGTDGKLSSEQIPDMEALGAIEYINSLPFTRKNLLDNWYFADPIDQRDGWVVKPNVVYHLWGELTEVGITPMWIQTWGRDDDGNGWITIDGVNYWVDAVNTVRGYVASGYGIDRWNLSANPSDEAVLLIEESYIRVINGNSFRQPIDNLKRFAGKTVTFSILIECISGGTGQIGFVADDSWVLPVVATPETARKKTLISATVSIPENITTLNAWYYGSEGTDYKFYAAKLELGTTQTLARQDENGNWVLNDPPPNRAMELAKCQRYYQLFSSADTRPENLADYRPTMRANPVLGTININGQTMYFADANL